MFKITCFVKASSKLRKFHFSPLPPFILASAGIVVGNRNGVDGWQGEPSVVLYAGGSSSPRSARCSWGLASPAFSPMGRWGGLVCKRRRSHFLASIPKSRRFFSSSWVSSKKSNPIKTPNAMRTAQTRLGSRNGNWSKIVPRAKNVGKDSQGWAKAPPSAGPRTDLYSMH